MEPPTRAQVETVWRSLIAGVLGREDVHLWARPWVEERWQEVLDPPTESGLMALHGFDLTYDVGRPRVVRHGPGDRYHHSDEHIAEELDRWLVRCRDYDAGKRRS